MADVLVLFEHPDWQRPLFAALDRRGVAYETLEGSGITVVNGAHAFAFELSKTTESAVIRHLGLRTPHLPPVLDSYMRRGLVRTSPWNGSDRTQIHASRGGEVSLRCNACRASASAGTRPCTPHIPRTLPR